MNVLSLFDGMSCGQIALKELNISVGTYYASEIDRFAIAQTQLNFPNTIQIGDVKKVNVLDLQPKGISPAVLTNMSCGSHAVLDNFCIRRLTPTECAKLQTIPEWYKWQCSNTQQYKMLGNGWTVEVIKHIFSYMIE